MIVADEVPTVPEGPLEVVSGGVRSTFHVIDAGVLSTLPAPSVARTENVWTPSPRPVYSFDEVQALQAPESSLHSKVPPASVEAKENEAVVWLVKLTADEVIEVSGARLSTVHVWTAGEESVLPAPSVARTSTLWAPSVRPVSDIGEVQVVHGALLLDASTRHSKVEPLSFAEKARVAELDLVFALGPESTVVSGAVRSTFHVYDVGGFSTFPSESVPRTEKVWLPSESALKLRGDVQVAQLAVSSLHSYVAEPSSEENVKSALFEVVASGGVAEKLDAGAVASTVQVLETMAPVLPAGSVARTETV